MSLVRYMLVCKAWNEPALLFNVRAAALIFTDVPHGLGVCCKFGKRQSAWPPCWCIVVLALPPTPPTVFSCSLHRVPHSNTRTRRYDYSLTSELLWDRLSIVKLHPQGQSRAHVLRFQLYDVSLTKPKAESRGKSLRKKQRLRLVHSTVIRISIVRTRIPSIPSQVVAMKHAVS